MKHFLLHKTKGFTLLETLTSIAILTLTIIGPLAVIMGSSSYAKQTKDVMTATYLAEEALELLQNQYDSLYVYCANNPSDTYCTQTSVEETPGQIAWRLYKGRLAANGGNPSCYKDNNPSGCTFDYIDMTGNATVTPTRYISTDATCLYLVGMTTTRSGGQYETPTSVTNYVCRGEYGHVTGQATGAQYTRKVTLEKIPATFEQSLPEDEQYNGDIRAVVDVTFRGANGVQKTLSLTRFFHARP